MLVKPSLLLVDDDSRTLRVLEVSLKKSGFSVTTATSGRDALARIETSAPDIIITETKLPEMDGFALVRRLRERSEWSTIPVIFLAAEARTEDRIRSLEVGVEDFLAKPYYLKEIVERVRLLLAKRQRQSIEDTKRELKTKFSGSIADMAVVDLIQTIEVSRKSGVIHLRGPEGRRAAIYFRSGKVIDAEVGRLVGEDAVYRMLVWSDGEFELEFKNIRRRDIIDVSSQALLLEGMRRVDEWGRLAEQLPPLDTVFEVDHKLLGDRLGDIPDEVNGILRLFDGRRSVMQVVDDSPFSDLEALNIVSKLFFEGIVYSAGVVAAPIVDEPRLSEDDHDEDARREAPEGWGVGVNEEHDSDIEVATAAITPSVAAMASGGAGAVAGVAYSTVEVSRGMSSSSTGGGSASSLSGAADDFEKLELEGDDRDQIVEPKANLNEAKAKPSSEGVVVPIRPAQAAQPNTPVARIALKKAPRTADPPSPNDLLQPVSGETSLADKPARSLDAEPSVVVSVGVKSDKRDRERDRDRDRDKDSETTTRLEVQKPSDLDDDIELPETEPRRGALMLIGGGVILFVAMLVYSNSSKGPATPTPTAPTSSSPSTISAEPATPAPATTAAAPTEGTPPPVAATPGPTPTAAAPTAAAPTEGTPPPVAVAPNAAVAPTAATPVAATPAPTTATPAPTAATSTPMAATPAPVAATPTPAPTPVAATPTPAPVPVAATPTPTPAPVAATPTPTPAPVAAKPAPAPIAATPTPAPAAGDKTGSQALVDEANAAYKKGQEKKALALIEEAVLQDANNAEAFALAASIYLNRGNMPKALIAAEKSVALNPSGAEPYVVLGAAYQTSGKIAQAKTAYQTYLKLAPTGKNAADIRAVLNSIR